MAKKKTDDSVGLANVDEHLQKKFGKEIFVSGESIVATPRRVIPMSPAMDLMLGGGVPEGSFCISTGPPKVGKTTAWLDFAGTAQKDKSDLFPDGRHVYFLNIEGRIGARDLEGIKHLDLTEKHFTAVQSQPGRILNAEDYLEIAETYIHTKPGCVIVIDSFSQLCSGARKASDYKTRFRDDVPLMLSDFCKKVCNVIPVNKCIVLGVTHMIANQGGQGMSPWLEASGRKLQYQMDIKLKATYRKLYPEDAPFGQEVYWECYTSALGKPGLKAKSFLRYGLGLDKVFELVDLCKDLGLIQKARSWYSYQDTKVQGFDNLVEHIRDNNLYDELNKEYRTLMGLPI